MPVLRANDLRHYLNQRLAAAAEDAADDRRKGGQHRANDGDKSARC